jgi:hypothetical protein
MYAKMSMSVVGEGVERGLASIDDDDVRAITLVFLRAIKDYQPVLLQPTLLSGTRGVGSVLVRAGSQPLGGLFLHDAVLIGRSAFRCLRRGGGRCRWKFHFDPLRPLRERVWKYEWG